MSPLPDRIEAEAFEAYVIDVIGRRWPVDVVSVEDCRRLVEEAETIAENQLDEMRDDLHATEQKLATCAAELDHSVEMWTRLELERCIAIVEQEHAAWVATTEGDRERDAIEEVLAALRSGSPSNPPTDRPATCMCGHGAERHGPEAGCIECGCDRKWLRPPTESEKATDD